MYQFIEKRLFKFNPLKSPINNNKMKWIKASERLPELNKIVVVRNVDSGEYEGVAFLFQRDRRCRKVFDFGEYSINEKYFKIYEWLDESDESPSPSLSAEQEAREYAERVFVEVFNIDTTKESVIKAIAAAYLAGKASGEDGAILFAKWIASHGLNDIKDLSADHFTLVDGDWYWNEDKDGDQPLTEEQLYEMYLASTPPVK